MGTSKSGNSRASRPRLQAARHRCVLEGSHYHGTQPERHSLQAHVLGRVPGLDLHVAQPALPVLRGRARGDSRDRDHRGGAPQRVLVPRCGAERGPSVARRTQGELVSLRRVRVDPGRERLDGAGDDIELERVERSRRRRRPLALCRVGDALPRPQELRDLRETERLGLEHSNRSAQAQRALYREAAVVPWRRQSHAHRLSPGRAAA
jgi:hypothetical protein